MCRCQPSVHEANSRTPTPRTSRHGQGTSCRSAGPGETVVPVPIPCQTDRAVGEAVIRGPIKESVFGGCGPCQPRRARPHSVVVLVSHAAAVRIAFLRSPAGRARGAAVVARVARSCVYRLRFREWSSCCICILGRVWSPRRRRSNGRLGAQIAGAAPDRVESIGKFSIWGPLAGPNGRAAPRGSQWYHRRLDWSKCARDRPI